MPRYDYECSACNHSEEIFQRMADEPLTKCTACKKKKFRRVILTAPHTHVVHVTTVGQLADRNDKKMGKELRELKENKTRKNKTRKKPWYGELPKEKRNKVLSSKENVDNYIKMGKLP
jgi:putative FmdB family regulatory protein